MKPLLFLDRDGVINVDRHFVFRTKDVVFVEGIFELCHYFKSKDFEIVIVTNQSGVGRGIFSEQELRRVMTYILDKFQSEGLEILAYFYCPHTPLDMCMCRKPLPGLYTQAIKKFNVLAKDCISIGDQERDFIAAKKAGIGQNYLLVNDDQNSSKIFGPILVNSLAQIIQNHQSIPLIHKNDELLN